MSGFDNRREILYHGRVSITPAILPARIPMDIATLLYGLLSTDAGLAASAAAGEFGKGTGKAALDALVARLAGTHQVKSLALLADARSNPAYAAAIRSDLEKPGIGQDADLLTLADTLRAAIEALPPEAAAPYAVEIETIRSGGNLLFDTVAGIKSKLATSKGDIIFRNVTPPGKL